MDAEEFNQGCGAGGGDLSMGTDEFTPGCGGTGAGTKFTLLASDAKDYLCIPQDVNDQFRHLFPFGPIELEDPDGHVYTVQVVKLGPITLATGWRLFVDENHIQQGDPILFVNCGRYKFKVQRAGPPRVLNDSVVDLNSDDDEVMGEGTTTARREQTPLPLYRAKAQKMPSTSSPYTKSGHKAGKSNEAGLEAPMSHKPYIFTKLDWQHEPEVKEKVHAIESEFPVFVKQMSASDILKPQELYFCKEYAMAVCLPLKKTPVLLQLEGSEMQWFSMLVVCKNARRICSFWKDLVLQAKMKQGDICLVELAERSSESLTMMVHLIRK